MTPRALRLPGLLALALGLVGAVVADRLFGWAQASVFDDDRENYQIVAPDTWVRNDPTPFEAQSVKLFLQRTLKTLQTAKGEVPATGEGARMMLSVSDKLPKALDPDYETWLANWQILAGESARLNEQFQGIAKENIPKPMLDRMELVEKLTKEAREKVEKGLIALGNDREVQSLLLTRFDKDPKKWPTPEIDEHYDLSFIPAVEVAVKRVECPNLEGNLQPCEARMVVCVLRKKTYRLAFWVWRQKLGDPEHLKAEADMVELSFQFLKTTAIPRRPDDKPTLPPAAGGGAPSGPELDEGTDHDLSMSFSVLKPKGWKRTAIDRSNPQMKDLGFRFSVVDGTGAEIDVDLVSYRIGPLGTGFSVDTHLPELWKIFLQTHPTGALLTHPFPTYSERSPFLSLPNLDKKVVLKRPPPPVKDKKPEEVSKDDLEQKDVVEHVKQASITKEKIRASWRYCLFGQGMSGIGDDLHLEYIWGTVERDYILRVFVRKNAMEKWGPDLKRCLDSFRLENPK